MLLDAAYAGLSLAPSAPSSSSSTYQHGSQASHNVEQRGLQEEAERLAAERQAAEEEQVQISVEYAPSGESFVWGERHVTPPSPQGDAAPPRRHLRSHIRTHTG